MATFAALTLAACGSSSSDDSKKAEEVVCKTGEKKVDGKCVADKPVVKTDAVSLLTHAADFQKPLTTFAEAVTGIDLSKADDEKAEQVTAAVKAYKEVLLAKAAMDKVIEAVTNADHKKVLAKIMEDNKALFGYDEAKVKTAMEAKESLATLKTVAQTALDAVKGVGANLGNTIFQNTATLAIAYHAAITAVVDENDTANVAKAVTAYNALKASEKETKVYVAALPEALQKVSEGPLKAISTLIPDEKIDEKVKNADDLANLKADATRLVAKIEELSKQGDEDSGDKKPDDKESGDKKPVTDPVDTLLQLQDVYAKALGAIDDTKPITITAATAAYEALKKKH